MFSKILLKVRMLYSFSICIVVYNHIVVSSNEDGGWTTDPSARLAQPGPCNIEIEYDTSMTQKEFLNRYAFSEPVIVRRSTDNSAFQKMCEKDEMLKKYSDKTIRISTANTHSYKKVDMKLSEYVTEILKPQSVDLLLKGNETLYWFGDNDHEEWKELFDAYIPPEFELPGLSPMYSFGVAGAGTGVPFHFHGPGFAETIFGRKRWFLYPPKQEPFFHPNYTTLHWFLNDYPNLPREKLPLECTLNPGEAIYFPDHWWHGTLNIDTGVFISTFLG